jgi:hypothetical protein
MPLTTVGTSMISSGGGNVATNTALGSGAGSSNTTGDQNTFIGQEAGFTNSTGAENTFVGRRAGYLSTASANTGVGTIALRFNSSGANNTGIGYGALYANTTANSNTAIGYQAGYSCTTSNNNVFVGALAGTSTNGPGNVFIGTQAGQAVTTGSANCFVGSAWNTTGAGSAMTTGTKNTILGSFTGNQGGLDIRTLSNRIVLSDGDGNPRGIFDGDGSFYVGLTPPPGYGGNAAYVITYLGSTRPGIRFYDTLTGSSPSTVQNFVRNGSSVGQIYTTDTATAYVTSSDYRLKENIAPMTGALAKVSQLKPCTYTWKSSGSAGQGFIAHELQEVVPEGVYGEKDGMETVQYEVSPAVLATYDEEGNELTPAIEAVMGEREVPAYQGIDTSFLVATLTAAIQEQQAIITDLKARIETLEAK